MKESKKKSKLSLILISAPDDPPVHSMDYQEELKAFARSLTANGIEFTSRMCVMESASGGGFNLGEFGIIATSIAPITGLIGAWLHAKYGRKVKLKFDDVTIEAANVEEAEKLIKLVEKHRKKNSHA